MNKSRYLQGKRIAPTPITKETSIVQLIENNFQAYNAARLREGAQLFAERMLQDDVTICLTLTGALTPAGLGISAIIPLIEAGFVDWVITTGANLYHDAHFGLGLSMRRGSHQISDVTLREEGVVRIYDIFFDYEVLLSTDAFFREIIRAEEFQREMSTAEFHYLCGKYVAERERALGLRDQSLLAAAYPHGQTRRGKIGGLHLRRRQPKKLRAANRAADSRGAGHRRKRPRLLFAIDGRPPRHRRPMCSGRHAYRYAKGFEPIP